MTMKKLRRLSITGFSGVRHSVSIDLSRNECRQKTYTIMLMILPFCYKVEFSWKMTQIMAFNLF